jgi:hypothetical protein
MGFNLSLSDPLGLAKLEIGNKDKGRRHCHHHQNQGPQVVNNYFVAPGGQVNNGSNVANANAGPQMQGNGMMQMLMQFMQMMMQMQGQGAQSGFSQGGAFASASAGSFLG